MKLFFKCSLLFSFLSASFHTTSLYASTFENMEGIYKITSCKNQTGSPSPWDMTLCENTQLTVHPALLGTSFYFSKIVDSQTQIKNFEVPPNMSTHPGGKYTEQGDYLAAYTNDEKDYGEVFVMKKNGNNLYHLSMHRRSDLFNTLDMFEIDLEKTANRTDPAPSAPNTKAKK
ncbi:MAG: hypothetical protein ACXVCY_08335 [Pseudobdellovibrionaceae bacterium]